MAALGSCFTAFTLVCYKLFACLLPARAHNYLRAFAHGVRLHDTLLSYLSAWFTHCHFKSLLKSCAQLGALRAPIPVWEGDLDGWPSPSLRTPQLGDPASLSLRIALCLTWRLLLPPNACGNR